MILEVLENSALYKTGVTLVLYQVDIFLESRIAEVRLLEILKNSVF